MKFKSGINEVDLIETVGELREAIADLADDTPIRFSDPDTNWLMRLAEIVDDHTLGWDDEGRKVFTTQEYWMSPLEHITGGNDE